MCRAMPWPEADAIASLALPLLAELLKREKSSSGSLRSPAGAMAARIAGEFSATLTLARSRQSSEELRDTADSGGMWSAESLLLTSLSWVS